MVDLVVNNDITPEESKKKTPKKEVDRTKETIFKPSLSEVNKILAQHYTSLFNELQPYTHTELSIQSGGIIILRYFNQ